MKPRPRSFGSIFERFLKVGSATMLARNLVRRTSRNKYGKLIDKGMLYKMLNNRVYIGDAVHKGTSPTPASTSASSIARSGTRSKASSRRAPANEPVRLGHKRLPC